MSNGVFLALRSRNDLSLRSRRQHKAWAQAPGKQIYFGFSRSPKSHQRQLVDRSNTFYPDNYPSALKSHQRQLVDRSNAV